MATNHLKFHYRVNNSLPRSPFTIQNQVNRLKALSL